MLGASAVRDGGATAARRRAAQSVGVMCLQIGAHFECLADYATSVAKSVPRGPWPLGTRGPWPLVPWALGLWAQRDLVPEPPLALGRAGPLAVGPRRCLVQK